MAAMAHARRWRSQINRQGGQDIDAQADRSRSSDRTATGKRRRPGRPGHGSPPVRDGDPGHHRRDPARRPALSASNQAQGNQADASKPGVRVRLYDADGIDRETDARAGLAGKLEERQLLWIDVLGREQADLHTVAEAVGIDRHLSEQLARESGRAEMTEHSDHIHLVLQSMDLAGPGVDDGSAPERQEIDLVAGRNWVVTVHTEPIAALDRIEELTHGETRFGALDAAGFLAAIIDEVLAGYLALAGAIEQEIDRLDERALRTRPSNEVLSRIVALRRRIGTIRRTLTPHRMALAALARPEMELFEELGRPWPGLSDRLDRAIDAVENLRDLLLGTFDIHTARAAQEANDVMKRLTLLSAVLLPAVVLAGVMGMNFKMSFFDDTTNFWVVLGAMGAFGVILLVVARWRAWL
jgi:magnesium transporter